ncbi:UDP-glucose 4-epimerase GalE [Luteimonas soli]|uniref:UDP-glucose 4-epimerase n=1 Tax=Luteimonas soli TaxID=1648966 RepID=A0ABV7XF48_9GAMM
MNILVTGGAGYIGSHTVVQLLERGATVTVLDNLANGSLVAIRRVAELTGVQVDFIHGDICDPVVVGSVFGSREVDAVVHFAGLKAVGESVAEPLRYFRNNVAGTLNLLEAMSAASVKKLVFSSSATVYGVPDVVPIQEPARRLAVNPYGRSKLMIEEMLEDVQAADPQWGIVSLRYFNPVGAHPSGTIGEDPAGIPNNLMPFITQVACGRRDRLSVFGGDYPTIDGTGVRDYIHVQDLARGHLAALDYLAGPGTTGVSAVNLGTGRGISVLELVRAFEKANGVAVPYEIVDRRPGDVATCFADPSLAQCLFGWSAELGVEDMCRDAWNWQSQNPMGYVD